MKGIAVLILAVTGVSVYGQSYGKVDLPARLADSGTTVKAVKTHLLYCEGPVADKNGNVFFSEQGSSPTDSVIWKVTPAGVASIWRTGIKVPNGNAFSIDGNMLCCESQKLVECDSSGNVVKTLVSGSSFGNINDLSIASDGGVFFTNNVSNFWFRSKDSVITTFTLTNQDPNGIYYVEEKNKLYVNLWSQNKVVVYTVGANHAVNTASEKTFCSVGGPDGIKVDSEYNVYVASNTSTGSTPGCIVVFDSLGDSLGKIVMQQDNNQNSNASNCNFGGPGNKTLYITGDSGCFSVQLKVPGRVVPVTTAVRQPTGGSVPFNGANRQTKQQLFLGGTRSAGVGSPLQDMANPSILYDLNGRRVYTATPLPHSSGQANIPLGLSPAVLIERTNPAP